MGEEEKLDPVVRALRAAKAIDREDDEQVIAAAMLVGVQRHRRRAWVRTIAPVFAAAAVFALAFLVRENAGTLPSDELLAVELGTGDHISAVLGARFRVDSDDIEHRVLALDSGAMLFDVHPLAEGQRFEVITPNARVFVRGTVFAVEVGARGTSVEVFEGRVQVDERGETRFLRRGERFAPDRSEGGLAQLSATGLRMASARTAAVEVAVSSVEPVIEALVEPSSEENLEPSTSDPAQQIERSAPRRAVEMPEVALPSQTPSEEEPNAAPPTAVSLEQARGWIAVGRAEDAERAAREAMAAGEPAARWLLVQADALHALSRNAEAAQRYDQAARGLQGDEQVIAGYHAARLFANELGDPASAIASLDRAHVDAQGSPIAERALVVRANALEALGRREELREVVEHYLASYPHGSRAIWMRSRMTTEP